MSDRLVTFLYVLMRDHVTAGVIEGVMAGHVEHPAAASGTRYSNPHLEAHSRELADRLAAESATIAGVQSETDRGSSR